MFSNLLPKVLIVDDEPSMRTYLRRVLEPMAAKMVDVADATQALDAIESGDFDIVLSDMYMPGVSGLELLAMAKRSQWDVAFILITGRPNTEEIIEALRMQAADFLLKPFDGNTLANSIKRSFQKLIIEREAHAYRGSLETSIQRRTRDLESALQYVESNYQATLEALVAALDAREHETYSHSFRVRAYTTYLARLVGYPPALIPQLDNASLLHDIGKIAVSDLILLKPAKLTDEEWVEMRKHSVAGEQILKRISFLSPASAIIRHHHERFDGKGYPDGIGREDIPLGARLFTFADTLDAMTSDRFYRKALPFDAVGPEVERCAGAQFDPRIAKFFLKIPEKTWKGLRDRVEQEQSASAIPEEAKSA